jgi:hypothetical protein
MLVAIKNLLPEGQTPHTIFWLARYSHPCYRQRRIVDLELETWATRKDMATLRSGKGHCHH